VHRLVEAEANLGLEVAALLDSRALLPAATEERGEDVAEIGSEAAAREPAGKAPGAEAAEAAARVVLLALLGVRERVVGLLDLLEALLGLLVIRVAIRMPLPSELAVGALDLVLRRRPLDAEDLVEVTRLRHYWLTTTFAARSTWPFSR
jgi:hypothetical protein